MEFDFLELPEDLDLPAFDVVDDGLFDDYLSALGSGALLQPQPQPQASPSSDGSGPPAASRASRAQCADSGPHVDSDSGIALPCGGSTASGQNSTGSPTAVFTASHASHDSPGTGFAVRSPSADSNRPAQPSPPWAGGGSYGGGYNGAPQYQQPADSSPPPRQPQGQWQPQQGTASLPPIIELPSVPGASLGLPVSSLGLGMDFSLPELDAAAAPWPPASLAAAPDWGLQQQQLLMPQHSMALAGLPGQLQPAGAPAPGFAAGAELRLGLDQPGAAGGSNNQSSLMRGGEDVRGLLSSPPPNASGGSGAAAGSPAQGGKAGAGGAGEPESEEDAAGGSGKKPRRRRNRSERQQMLNKLAQQRYRERKKQKAADIERAAAELSGRMQQASLVEARHAQLTAQHAGLAAQLAAKEAELAQARAAAAQGDLAEAGSLEQELAEAEAAAAAAQHTAFQLRAFLGPRGLLAPGLGAAAAAQLSPGELRELEGLVQAASSAAARQQQLEGADAWQLVRAGAPGSPAPGSGGWEAWAETARALQLSPEQCRKFVHVRRQYVRKLEGVFAERQQLNLQAVGVMLPQDRGGSGAQMLSGQVAGYVLLGFFQRARQSARLADVLEALRANLRAEQRAAAEVEYITQRRILGPLQAAWLLLRAHPRRPDCLALAAAVAHLCGDASPAPAPAAAAAWPGATGGGGLPGFGGGLPAASGPFQLHMQ